MLTFATLAQAVADGDGWGQMDGWSGRWMWFWGTLMLASWVAVIAGAVWLLMRSHDRGVPHGSRAREIVEERYARGELSTDEFRERVNHLR
jgi:putative membrane protein